MTDVTDGYGAGGDISAVTEALAGLVGDFRDFRGRIEDRITKQDERLTMTMQTQTRRPTLAAAETEAPHGKAMDAYLRSGDDDALRTLVLEGKGMNTAVSAEGGYLVDPRTAQTVTSVLRSTASLRSVAGVVTVEATSYDVLVDRSDAGAGWSSEAVPVAETDSPLFDRISIPLHELAALPKASQRLLDDAAFDVETWLAGRIADKFARAEASAFVTGDGVQKPRGFLTYAAVPQADWAWGKLGYVPSGTDADFDATDPSSAIVDLIYALGARYRAAASFVMNSKTAGAVRKMKDADGPVPVVRQPGGGPAVAADGLPGAHRRGHARHRRGRAGHRLRRLRRGLHHRRAPGPARPARPVQRQAARPVLRDQARRRRRDRLRGDQAAEVLGRMSRRRGPARPAASDPRAPARRPGRRGRALPARSAWVAARPRHDPTPILPRRAR